MNSFFSKLKTNFSNLTVDKIILYFTFVTTTVSFAYNFYQIHLIKSIIIKQDAELKMFNSQFSKLIHELKVSRGAEKVLTGEVTKLQDSVEAIRSIGSDELFAMSLVGFIVGLSVVIVFACTRKGPNADLGVLNPVFKDMQENEYITTLIFDIVNRGFNILENILQNLSKFCTSFEPMSIDFVEFQHNFIIRGIMELNPDRFFKFINLISEYMMFYNTNNFSILMFIQELNISSTFSKLISVFQTFIP